MTKEQLDKIQRLTGYSLNDIIDMSDTEFFFKITGLLAKGVINNRQHEFFKHKRLVKLCGGEQTMIDALNIFGGQLLK